MASTIRGNDNFDSAGPFGASTLISDNVSVGTGATFSVSFSGNYRAYRLILNGIYSNSNFQQLVWRYTDGSGNNMTASNTYAFQYAMSDYTLRKTNDDRMTIPEYYRQIYSTERAYIDMVIYNPKSSTEVTTQKGTFWFGIDNYYSGNFTSQVTSQTYGIGANNSIYFYHSQGGNFSGGTYSLWGLN